METPSPGTACAVQARLSSLPGKGQESAFVVSVDLCGPITTGTDLGVSKRRKVKYAFIATIPVPQWPSLGEREISPKDPKVDPEADSKEAPKG